jgi:hypothetical protein
LLLLTYSLGATALLLRLLIGRRILARLWREADALPDPAWQRLLSRLSSEMLLSRPVELRIARGPIMPMTWGTLAPKVLLPAEASEWAPERRRLVLLHELAHVARRDSLSRSVASLACALYWFHPGAWLAARQMRVEQEHAADDRVLAAGGSAQAYARSLLHLARGLEGPRPAHAATMAGACQLERRLTSITTPVRRDRPGPAFLSFAVLCALLATLVVAAGVPVSPSSLLPNPLRAGPGGIASLPPPPAARSVAAVAEHRASKDALAAPGESQERDRSRRPDSSPRQDEAKSLGAAESPDRQQPPATLAELPDYRWQLPQRGSAMQIAAIPGPSNANRVLLTPPPASDERSARLKWPRMVPRPILPATTTRSNPFTPRRPLMLSWSLDAAPR